MKDKHDAYKGVFVHSIQGSKKGELVAESNIGFKRSKVWKFKHSEGVTYFVAMYIGQSKGDCPYCDSDLSPPYCESSYLDEHERSCKLTFEESIKLYKKNNPDMTKDWDFGDPFSTLESALISFVNDLVYPQRAY